MESVGRFGRGGVWSPCPWYLAASPVGEQARGEPVIWMAIAFAVETWQWRSPPLAPAPSWREARAPFEDVVEHAVTVDREGKLLLATLERPGDGEALARLSAWQDGAWKDVRVVATELYDWLEPKYLDVAAADDGDAWLAWVTASRTVEVVHGRSGRWTLRPPCPCVPLAVAVLPDEAAVVGAFQRRGQTDEELWFLPMEGPRRRLAVGDHIEVHRRLGRSAFTVYDYDLDNRIAATWPTTRRRQPDMDRVFRAWAVPTRRGVRWETYGRAVFSRPDQGHGWPLVARGHIRFAGTHGNPDVNRVEVRRRGLPGRLAPPGERSLRVPQEQPQHDLLRTPTPTLVVPLDEGVGVLQWTGSTWWGLGGDPVVSGGLGDPERPSSKPWFSGEHLRWVEQDDRHGHVVMDLPLGSAGDATELRASHRVQLSGAGADVMTGRFCDDCGWDRVNGVDYEPVLQRVTQEGLQSVPMPSVEACGGDPERHVCRFQALQRSGAGLLAAVDAASTVPWSFDMPSKPPHLMRWDGGTWKHEADAPEGTANYSQAFLLDAEPLLAAFLAHDWRDGMIAARVMRGDEAGWAELVLGREALTTELPREDVMYGFDRAAEGLTDAEGHLWLAWRRQLVEDHARLAVAEYTEEGWVRREGTLPLVDAHRLAFHRGPTGRPVLAWADDDGVHVWRYDSVWRPLGEGVIWTGRAEHLAVATVGDELCVAFSAATEREDQIGLLCLPPG